jgi:probable phosphoglycerate mutase
VTASPLRRAADTAVIIAAELGVGPVPTDPDLMERDAGPWQGLTRDEIEALWPGHLDSGTRPEGYEDDVTLMGRVGAGLGRVVARTEGEALVVTHAGVIYALEKACGEPWTRIANLAGRWIEWLDGGLALGPRIEPIPDGTVPDLL